MATTTDHQLNYNCYLYKVTFSIIASPIAKFMVFAFRFIDGVADPVYNIDIAGAAAKNYILE
jgi:hypothetical protein